MGTINISFDHIKDIKDVSELSIVLYEDSFFYGLWSDNELLLKADHHATRNFEKMLEIWNKNYRLHKARVMSTVKPYAHLDTADYQEEYHDEYISQQYNLHLRNKPVKKHDSLLKEDVSTLHYIDKQFTKALSNYDYKYKAAHISTAMANYAYLIDTDLIGLISGECLHVCYVKNGQFQFYNQFYCTAAEDYLYHFLWVMKYFDLDPADQKLSLGGTIEKESNLYNLLTGYIREVAIMDENLLLPSETKFSKQLYLDLYLCKSCV